MAIPDHDTSLGGSKRDFPSTSWNLLRQVRERERESLERLIYLYWKPAYYYIRAAGRRRAEEAKDLTQEFFARLLERKDWERLSEERGSFRGFLKRSLKNFMIDDARRERARRPAGDALLFRFEDCRDEIADGDPETTFDREWIQTVLRDSIRELRERLRRDGSESVYEVFRQYCAPQGATGDAGETSSFMLGGGDRTYAEVAEAMGLRDSDVRKRLARCREILRGIVMERIREYASDEEEARSEYERIVTG